MTSAAEEPRRDSRLLMLAWHCAWLPAAVTLVLPVADDAPAWLRRAAVSLRHGSRQAAAQAGVSGA